MKDMTKGADKVSDNTETHKRNVDWYNTNPKLVREIIECPRCHKDTLYEIDNRITQKHQCQYCDFYFYTM